ncbi:MAG: SpoIIE family protein phosphatase [Opitutaceae bacterium]
MSEASAGPPSPADAGESLDSVILRVLMETIPDCIYFKDLQSRFVRVNVAQARLLGASSPEAVVGRTDFDYFSPEHAARALADEQGIIRTGVPMLGQVEMIMKADGARGWGSTTKMPWQDSLGRTIGTFGLTRDVTVARRAEDKVAEERRLLQTIIDLLPSRIFVKDADARFVVNNRAHLRWLGAARQEDVRGKTTADFYPGERGSRALADDRRVISTGEPILDHEKSDFGPAGSTRWSLTTKVPVRDLPGRITGVVGISHDITERKRIEEEVRRRTMEMEADLLMARQIQEAFLPRSYPVFPRDSAPESSALRFAHRYIPASSLGGDFFDVIQLSDTRCGVLICDVMGHGVRAGLLTAHIRGAIEELGERAEDPAQVLGEINQGLLPIVEKTGQPVFATAFFGVIDLEAGTLTYANAGHPPPFVLRPGSGRVERLVPRDPEPAAGLVHGFSYSRLSRPFQSGDRLFGYTDGLYEGADAAGDMYGRERLQAALERTLSSAPDPLLDAMIAGLEAFTARREFEDDVCLVLAWRP